MRRPARAAHVRRPAERRMRPFQPCRMRHGPHRRLSRSRMRRGPHAPIVKTSRMLRSVGAARQVAVGADGRADDRGRRTGARADRALHRPALARRRRDVLPARALSLGRAHRGELDRHPRGARAGARGPRGAAQLPGHLQGPDRDHRRRPLEDVLPLRIRLQGQARRRDVPADGGADARRSRG